MLLTFARTLTRISRTQALFMAATPPPPPEPASTTTPPAPLPHHNPPSQPASPAQPTKRTKLTMAAAQPEAPQRDTASLLQQDAVLGSAIPLQVKLLREGAKAPTRGSKYSAGYDVYVCEGGVVPARGKAMLNTGISIACPPGTYARVAPRSGLAAKHSLQTGAGVIDYDYRGEVKVLLFNHSDTDFPVEPGDRMAQMVLERIVNPDVVVVEELEGTERGAGGFGSTGGFAAAAAVAAAAKSNGTA